MKRLSPTLVAFVCLVALLGGGIFAYLNQGQATAAPTAQTQALHEHSQGDEHAPLTMIAYSSFTCPHCVDFNKEVMPKLVEKYVDTGKLRIIFRDFPSDAYALRASILAQCLPSEQYLPFVHVLYNNFDSWARNPKPLDVLMRYAQMAGLDEARAQACIDDNKLIDALIASRQDGIARYKIEGTPTFIFNDGAEKITGYRSFEDMVAVIDGLLAKKG